jgi:hypothetical protein
MIVIPELNLIIIQPPRTASTSLRQAILERYSNSKSIFRHMERDGIPVEYADYDVACIIRHPEKRLHSLWKYMRAQRPEDHSDQQWAIDVARDADRSFSDWLCDGSHPFNNRPKSDIPDPGYYDILHYSPATRKSLYSWARPDLGAVELLKMEDVDFLETRLDIKLPHLNASAPEKIAALEPRARSVLATYHAWDLFQYRSQPSKQHSSENTASCKEKDLLPGA